MKALCSAPDCDRESKAKGLCFKHYFRVRANGSLEKKQGRRVEKPCGFCGKTMVLKPGEAKKQGCCSLSCSSKLKAKQKGLNVEKSRFSCAGCGKDVERHVILTRESGKFCTKDCAYAHKRARKALRTARLEHERIERKQARQAAIEARPPKAPGKDRECVYCSTVFRSINGLRTCSPACAVDQGKKYKAAYRLTDTGRAIRRAAKKKRKAIERGAVRAESVHPEVVFERDHWRCKHCGISTPKKLRGSYQGNAPELDHVIPLSKGGAHTYANTQLLCRTCNGMKSDKPWGQIGLELPMGGHRIENIEEVKRPRALAFAQDFPPEQFKWQA